MKKQFLILLSIVAFGLNSFGQEENDKKNGRIGISYSFLGSNDIVYFKQLDGAASYSGEGFFAVGVNYLFPINKTFELETGLEFSKYKFIIQPNIPPGYDNSPFSFEYKMISIPLSLRINFYKYFFINGGFVFDFDVGDSY